MICKFPLEEDGKFDVSLNKLNKFSSIIRPFREFSEGHEFYKQLIELADLAWEKKVLKAA